MLSENLKGKTIAILGFKSMIGKILLKKIVSTLSGALAKLVLITFDEHSKNAETLLEESFQRDFYLKSIDLEQQRKLIQIVDLKSDLHHLEIDVLFNCLLPTDYTRSSI